MLSASQVPQNVAFFSSLSINSFVLANGCEHHFQINYITLKHRSTIICAAIFAELLGIAFHDSSYRHNFSFSRPQVLQNRNKLMATSLWWAVIEANEGKTASNYALRQFHASANHSSAITWSNNAVWWIYIRLDDHTMMSRLLRF